jgi:hypothetical protein
MVDWCSAALDFSGVTHGDSSGELTGSASSEINRKCSCTKDGLGGVSHGVSNSETIGGTNIGEKRQSPRWRSGAIIGLSGAAHRDGNGKTNSGVDGDDVDSILLVVVKPMGKDQWLWIPCCHMYTLSGPEAKWRGLTTAEHEEASSTIARGNGNSAEAAAADRIGRTKLGRWDQAKMSRWGLVARGY